MHNWKCVCGAVNFAEDTNCKRCQTARPQNFSLPNYVRQEFHEYTAPEGASASGGLKLIGIVALLGGMIVSATTFFGSGKDALPFAGYLAAMFLGQGVMIFSLFFGLGVMLENVVAIRKNTQHLAGIRANTVSEQSTTWQG